MNNKQNPIDNYTFFKNFLKIKDKNANIVPFIMNEPQKKLNDVVMRLKAEGKPVRIIILKARQMGFSTYTEGLLFKETVTRFNIKSGIITHTDKATENLFRMSKLFYTKMGDTKPQILASNAKELVFNNKNNSGMNSSLHCMTAGSESAGRSATFNLLHISEYAFWKGNKRDTLRGLLQSVPNSPNSIVIIESTANGYDEFKEMWDNAVSGKIDYTPVFFAWYELDEYKMPYYGFKLTEYEEDIKARYNLSNEQLAWRRWCIKNNCEGDEEYFNQEYPIDESCAFILTGSSVFDKEKVLKRLRDINNVNYTKGNFDYRYDGQAIDNIYFVKDKNGVINIYEEPKAGHPYVLAGDTAGDGSDYFTAQVIDNSNGRLVATLRQQTDEDLYAQQVFCLAAYYNEALLGLETNFSTFPTKELQRLEYPNLYIREQEDTFTGKTIRSYGFRTTVRTRPIILADLIRIVREDVECINDGETLREMLVFTRNRDRNGKMEALNGYHDDLIMALAIAYYIRGQQDFLVDETKFNTSNLLKSRSGERFIKYSNDEEGFMEWGED